MLINIKIYLLTLAGIIKYRYWINPLIPYSQFYLESNNFKSDIFKENKNLSGMKVNSRDFDIGKNRGHAVFPSVWACIQDYFARMKQFNVKPSNDVQEYILRVQASNYAEDPKYKSKVTAVYNQLDTATKPFFFWALRRFSILCIYLLEKILNDD